MKCFQCLTESEQAYWNVFSSYLESSMESNQPLLDLAELETCDQVQVDNIEDVLSTVAAVDLLKLFQVVQIVTNLLLFRAILSVLL